MRSYFMHKVFSLVAGALALGLLAAGPVRGAVIPATGSITAPGLYTIDGYTGAQPVHVTASGVALTGTHGSLQVVIGAGVTLTLKDAHIIATGPFNTATAAGGTGCGLILAGASSVQSDWQSAGVNVPATAALTIDGPGQLAATGGGSSAGSGGGGPGNGANITIINSAVTAQGGTEGAGIGAAAQPALNAPAASAAAVPTMGEWALGLLMAVLGWSAFAVRRRRKEEYVSFFIN